MSESVLNGKRMLAVDDEPDILETLADELDKFGVKLDQARSFEAGSQLLASYTYDLVILDIMGVRGFELLAIAKARNLPVVMLTAHALNADSLRRSIELGARAYLPKDEMGSIASFLEDVLNLTYQSAWKKLFTRLGGVFGKHFGPDWRKSEKQFWDEFEKSLEIEGPTVIQS
jgi:CheY-like chemotaxis protein